MYHDEKGNNMSERITKAPETMTSPGLRSPNQVLADYLAVMQ